MPGAMNDTTLALLSGPPQGTRNNGFGVIFTMTLIAFIGAGLYLKTVKPLPVKEDEQRVVQIRTQFVVPEEAKMASMAIAEAPRSCRRSTRRATSVRGHGHWPIRAKL